MRRAALLLLLLPACAPPAETAAPPEPAAATAPNPGFLARQQKTESLTCLPELPPGAEDALRAVRDAADRGDLQALRGWISEDMSWSNDPRALRQLVDVLDRGCLESSESKLVTCPPEHTTTPGYLGRRAGFARREVGWRMVFFVEGD